MYIYNINTDEFYQTKCYILCSQGTTYYYYYYSEYAMTILYNICEISIYSK